ncbi:MAG: HAD-IB family hydrolase [Bacteroidales bacterium]|nr:HAD-IB family hydrolase [Bacteroidales bacterium]
MEQQEKYVVFFDLDKTLLNINSSVPLILAAYKKGLLKTPSLLKAVMLSVIYKLRLGNTINITESMASWLNGLHESTVIELSGQLVKEKLIHKIRPSVIEEIKRHKTRGARMVILSASLPYTCEPIARHLKFDDVLCSSMEVVEGVFTGKPLGNICIEKEKEIRMRDYCLEKAFNLQDVWCFGDSYSDRFIMEICGNPVCVHPDSRLRKLAKNKNWKLMN